MEYKPSKKSFLGSFLYGLSPMIVAGIVMYFLAESAHFMMWVLSGVMILFSLYLSLQCIFVHMEKLYLEDDGIRTLGLLAKVAMRWSEIDSAVLRERNNAMSRTDNLLILESRDQKLIFNTSTLNPEDERQVLAKVREKTKLVIFKDKPSI